MSTSAIAVHLTKSIVHGIMDFISKVNYHRCYVYKMKADTFKILNGLDTIAYDLKDEK